MYSASTSQSLAWSSFALVLQSLCRSYSVNSATLQMMVLYLDLVPAGALQNGVGVFKSRPIETGAFKTTIFKIVPVRARYVRRRCLRIG